MSSVGSLSPIRTVVTNFSARTSSEAAQDGYEDGVWVLHVCNSSSWLGCSLSSGCLQVYDSERLQLMHTYTNCHQGGQISDISSDYFNALVSCSTDGSCCLFDVRQHDKPSLRFQLDNKHDEALSVALGHGGALCAIGGSKAQIHFFDLRGGGKLLGSYVDSHTEDVTQVRFQPGETAGETTSLLVSASEDGLACIFDTNQPSEEAALQGVLNVQTPLRQVGFFGPSYEGVYCLTGSETLSVWHHDTAQRICDFGATLREELTSVIGTPVQYLVDCYWNPSKNNLCLLTGSHTGEGSVFQVDAGRIFPLFNLNNGHKGDIRSWCHIAANRFVTVGEDARLCEWCQLGPGAVSNQAVVSRSGAPVRKEKASKATSRAVSNPY